MKSIVLRLVLTAVVLGIMPAAISYSQTSIGLGLEAGINLADITTTPVFTTTGRTGMMFGGFVDIGVSRSFSVKPGLRYISKGFTGTNAFAQQYTDKLSYLEIPLLLKVSFPLAEVKPYLEAGPSLGIQLSASEQLSNVQQQQDLDASTVYESTDFGLYFGGGIDFRVAPKTELFSGFGYSLGLSNIAKVTNVSAKNLGFRVSAGVKFGL